jgi:uncharacterized DUF497 family protein
MKFEWDKRKNDLNTIKHGISFEIASLVFHDPYQISLLDQRYDYSENHWITIGAIENTVIYVAHIIKEDNYDEEEIIPIISARTATPSEEWKYRSYGKNAARN